VQNSTGFTGQLRPMGRKYMLEEQVKMFLIINTEKKAKSIISL